MPAARTAVLSGHSERKCGARLFDRRVPHRCLRLQQRLLSGVFSVSKGRLQSCLMQRPRLRPAGAVFRCTKCCKTKIVAQAQKWFGFVHRAVQIKRPENRIYAKRISLLKFALQTGKKQAEKNEAHRQREVSPHVCRVSTQFQHIKIRLLRPSSGLYGEVRSSISTAYVNMR